MRVDQINLRKGEVPSESRHVILHLYEEEFIFADKKTVQTRIVSLSLRASLATKVLTKDHSNSLNSKGSVVFRRKLTKIELL